MELFGYLRLDLRCSKLTVKDGLARSNLYGGCLGMSVDAKAGEQADVLYRVSCTVVRFHVARLLR
jgi:hypothetical protein